MQRWKDNIRKLIHLGHVHETASGETGDPATVVPSVTNSPQPSGDRREKMTVEDPIPKVASVKRHHEQHPSSVTLDALPAFKDAPTSQWGSLLLLKIDQCTHLFDFELDSPLEQRNREIKTQALTEMLELLRGCRGVLQEEHYAKLMPMIDHNVLRITPPLVNPYGAEWDPEEDEPVLDPAWPHLQLVYEVWLAWLEMADFSLAWAKPLYDSQLAIRLMDRLDGEDPREREYVKTIVHRVYGKFLALRSPIRRHMRHVFCEFVYEGERHNIAELLEILGR